MSKRRLAIAWTVAAIAALGLSSNELSARRDPGLPIPQGFAVFASDATVNAIFRRSCADCHSNETKWPWYARARPIGWLIQRDVTRGRKKLNFSTGLPLAPHEKQEISDAASDRSMPPSLYVLMHPESRLSAGDLEAIEAWADR